MTSILEKTRFLTAHKPKKPGFSQFLGCVTSILEKTRFLATHPLFIEGILHLAILAGVVNFLP
ncbi:hypothetical protein, partial [Tychonema sp. LEGE 07203]|uniref:hypothetical protein n=1 Tax=Tychonema sp. LEGE 07203 TaxID=1828671 RepID=UPI001D15D87C